MMRLRNELRRSTSDRLRCVRGPFPDGSACDRATSTTLRFHVVGTCDCTPLPIARHARRPMVAVGWAACDTHQTQQRGAGRRRLERIARQRVMSKSEPTAVARTSLSRDRQPSLQAHRGLGRRSAPYKSAPRDPFGELAEGDQLTAKLEELVGAGSRAFPFLVPVTGSEGTQQWDYPRSIGSSPTRTGSPGCLPRAGWRMSSPGCGGPGSRPAERLICRTASLASPTSP